MRKIREVLRLESLGLTQREIARSCSVGQSTVSEYLKAAESVGLRWADLADWDQARLQEALLPSQPTAKEQVRRRDEPGAGLRRRARRQPLHLRRSHLDAGSSIGGAGGRRSRRECREGFGDYDQVSGVGYGGYVIVWNANASGDGAGELARDGSDGVGIAAAADGIDQQIRQELCGDGLCAVQREWDRIHHVAGRSELSSYLRDGCAEREEFPTSITDRRVRQRFGNTGEEARSMRPLARQDRVDREHYRERTDVGLVVMVCDATDVANQSAVPLVHGVQEERQWRDAHGGAVPGRVFTTRATEGPMGSDAQVTQGLQCARSDTADATGLKPVHEVLGDVGRVDAAAGCNRFAGGEGQLRVVGEDRPLGDPDLDGRGAAFVGAAPGVAEGAAQEAPEDLVFDWPNRWHACSLFFRESSNPFSCVAPLGWFPPFWCAAE